MISAGKLYRLQQCATPEGHLVILAVDHRHSLRRGLNPQDPAAVPDEALVAFKRDVVSAVAPAASAALLDPEYGALPAISAAALPGGSGLIVALERSGYTGDPAARQSELLPGWSPQRAAQIGASGVKLLVYYHPDAPTAPDIEALVRRVAEDAAEAQIPFLLEPVSYSLDPARPRLAGLLFLDAGRSGPLDGRPARGVRLAAGWGLRYRLGRWATVGFDVGLPLGPAVGNDAFRGHAALAWGF